MRKPNTHGRSLRVLVIDIGSCVCWLPTTLSAPDSNGGKSAAITFQRIIVWPDGHKEIEGVTPKQITHERMPHQPGVGENASNEDEQS